MAPKNILVIDDEKVVHLIFKTVLSDRYNLFFAESAQDGIDILSENPIHLLLLDIRMPEISGIELLESIVVDTALSMIPVIVMTAEATMDVEIKVRRLGAAHFLEKADLFYEKQNILNLVEKYISTDDHKTFLRYDYKQTFRSILTILMASAGKGDFQYASKKLGEGLFRMFDINVFSIWIVRNSKFEPVIRLVNGKSDHGSDFKKGSMTGEPELHNKNRPFLDNKARYEHSSEDENEERERFGYMSEIGVPLYKIKSNELIGNHLKVPAGTTSYGFVALKRSRVFSRKEYKMLSRFIMHTGSVLFEIYRQELNNKESNGVG